VACSVKKCISIRGPLSIVQKSEFKFNLREEICDESYTPALCAKNTIHGPQIAYASRVYPSDSPDLNPLNERKQGI
jgi:hypothetical protein